MSRIVRRPSVPLTAVTFVIGTWTIPLEDGALWPTLGQLSRVRQGRLAQGQQKTTLQVRDDCDLERFLRRVENIMRKPIFRYTIYQR